MRIAIVGAGAVGAYHGLKLAQGGNDVHFLLRSDFEVVRENGFELRDNGEVSRVRVNAYNSPQDIGQCDLVLIALKTTANSQFPVLLPPLVGKGTMILTLQNGLGNVEKLGELFGLENVLGGLCYVTINRTAPGVICNLGKTLLWIAEAVGEPRPRTHELAEVFRRAGFRTDVQNSLTETLWKKLCWNVPFNGLAIAGGNIDCAKLMTSPELVKESEILMRELQAAARACGVEIQDSHLKKQFEVTERIGDYLPSSLLDYRAGKPVEIESIWGEPLRRGKAQGVAMPHLEALYSRLKELCPQAS